MQEEPIDDVAVVVGTKPGPGEIGEVANFVGSYEDVAHLSTRTIADNITQAVDADDIGGHIAVVLVVEGQAVETNEQRLVGEELTHPDLVERIIEATVIDTLHRWRQ